AASSRWPGWPSWSPAGPDRRGRDAPGDLRGIVGDLRHDAGMTLLLCLGALLLGAGVGLVVGRGSAVRAAAERDALRGERDRLRAERAAGEDQFRAAEAEASGLRAALAAERAAGAERAA